VANQVYICKKLYQNAESINQIKSNVAYIAPYVASESEAHVVGAIGGVFTFIRTSQYFQTTFKYICIYLFIAS